MPGDYATTIRVSSNPDVIAAAAQAMTSLYHDLRARGLHDAAETVLDIHGLLFYEADDDE